MGEAHGKKEEGTPSLVSSHQPRRPGRQRVKVEAEGGDGGVGKAGILHLGLDGREGGRGSDGGGHDGGGRGDEG